MTKEVYELWPELNWIEDTDLRNKTAKTWELALERSVLSTADLNNQLLILSQNLMQKS